MKCKLQDLIDMEQFQHLQDRLNEIYCFPSAIIDNEGNILTATAWQDICTQFHRKHPDCERECRLSDQYILSHLHEANPAVSYRCPHGLVDNATPIIIDGVHYGNFFTGQFFLEKPDMEFFRAQAKRYGFDEDTYLKAVAKVPVWTQEQMNSYLFFIKGLIAVISESGLKKLKETEARKRIEESEQRNRIVLQTAMDGFWLTDPQGRLLEVNETYCQMSGYSEQELLAMRIPELEAAEREEDTATRLRKIMTQGEDRFESRHRRKDGSIFDVEVSVQYRPIEDGRMVAFLRDITERKQAEAALRLDGEILANLADGIFLIRASDGMIVHTNEQFEKMFGYGPGELIGQKVSVVNAFTDKNPDAIAHEIMESLSRAGAWAGEVHNLKKDGTTFWCSARVTTFEHDSYGTVWVAVHRDITERKRAAEALHKNQRVLRHVLDSVPQSVFWKDIKGVYLGCNQVFADAVGLKSPDGIIGKTDFDLPWTRAEAEAYRADDAEVISRKAPKSHIIEPVQQADGTLVWADTTKLPLLEDSGSVYGVLGVYEDITERKRAADALRESERHYRALVEGVPGIVYSYSTQRGGMYYSSHVTSLLGYSPEQLCAQPLLWHNSIHPDDLQRVEKVVRETATGIAFRIEYRIRDAQGNWHWFDDLSFGYHMDGPDVIIEGLALDITERKRAEAQIKQLSSAVEQSPVSIVITDLTGAIEYVNPKFTRVTGYPLEEVRGQNPRVLKGDKTSADEYRQLWESITQGREWRGEFHNRKKSGEMYWELALISPIVDAEGRITHFLAVKEDITERKQAEATMRQQTALLEITHDAIVVHDLDGRLLFMNKAAEELTGWSLTEAKTGDAKEILVFEPEVTRQTALHEALHQGAWLGELTLLNRQKKEIQLDSRWTLVRDEAGQPKAILMVSTDITRAKELKAQYLRAQRLESIGTLASGIAHDLNNVLSPVLMGLTVIKAEVKNEDSLAMIEMMENSARRGADTVKQLLTFARGTVAHKGMVQPRHLLKEVGQLLKRTFPKSIQIYTDYSSPWAILADPSQIHQVLMNLSVNARDAMPTGGVLFLKLRNQVLGEADVTLHPRAKHGPYVVFEVTDSGQGMPPEVVERIFEPFFTTKPQGQGTGLGLSTVIGIVEEHGGFVLVNTQMGHGTTFSAFLPAEPDSHETPDEVSCPESSPRHEEGILVVDDETSIVNVAHQFLTQQGYKVQTAKSASEGLELFQAHRSDIQLVITDLVMPFGDGWQLIQSLRELDPHLPILVMSGMLTPSLEAEILAQEDCRFLVKPFTAEELLAKLRDLLPGKP